MGLSAAWALARRGHRVSVHEQGPVPNPRGSSIDQHRLIRFPYGAQAGYTRMVAEAYGAWETLWEDLGETFYRPTGTLVLATTTGDSWADVSAGVLSRLGHRLQWLSIDEIDTRFPVLTAAGVRRAFYLKSGGALLASRIIAALAGHLERRGVRIVTHAPVVEVDPRTARIRLAGGASEDADVLVVAAGAWVRRLLPALVSRVTPSRQVVVYLAPPPDLAPHWAGAPMVLDIDPEAGFYLVPPVEGTDLKIGDHRFSLAGDPDGPREAEPREIETALAACRRRLRAFDRYRVAQVGVCFYIVESRERLILEPLERAWLVSACSGHGFKFGTVLGLALADAVDGRRDASR
jgi:glycine/D-amino acid oxidase-like deaminating enzyme